MRSLVFLALFISVTGIHSFAQTARVDVTDLIRLRTSLSCPDILILNNDDKTGAKLPQLIVSNKAMREDFINVTTNVMNMGNSQTRRVGMIIAKSTKQGQTAKVVTFFRVQLITMIVTPPPRPPRSASLCLRLFSFQHVTPQ